MQISTSQKRIVIAGASGYIGGRLAPRLLQDGYVVRCLVRSPGKLAGREWAAHPHVEVFHSNLEDTAGLTRDLGGCDAAFYLVHSMTSARGAYAEREHHIALRFASAAHDTGARRIIYLGGLGETGPKLTEHLSSRREVERALASTDVPVTTLRLLGLGPHLSKSCAI
jgi:uncharacterized protein YbjT (DUF2867 family)